MFVSVRMCVYTNWVTEWREPRGKENGVKETNSNHKLSQALILNRIAHSHTHTRIYIPIVSHTCIHTLYMSTNLVLIFTHKRTPRLDIDQLEPDFIRRRT